MADTYGAIAEPVPAPGATDTASDPALDVLLGFCQAVLNAKILAAFQAVFPGKRPVENVFANDPEREFFNDGKAPALFAFRKGGAAPSDLAVEWRASHDTISLLWVLPSTAQARQRLRSPLINGAAKMLDRSIWLGRDPAYTREGDTDPQAPTVAALPTSIKLAVATSTAAQNYSGAGLNGAIGVAAVSPRRAVIVALGGDPASFTPGSTIVVSGTNALGLAISQTLTVPNPVPALPLTLSTAVDFASVTSVAVAAQAGTAGTISVGTGAYAGLGSVLLRHMGLYTWIDQVRAASPRLVAIRPVEGGRALSYPAIEWQFTIHERLEFDPTEYPALGDANGHGLDEFITREDGSVFEEAQV